MNELLMNFRNQLYLSQNDIHVEKAKIALKTNFSCRQKNERKRYHSEFHIYCKNKSVIHTEIMNVNILKEFINYVYIRKHVTLLHYVLLYN